MAQKKNKRTYFTLVELMVVITIIGLLSGIVGLAVFEKVAQAKIATTRASIGEYSKAIEFYFMATGKYPSAMNDLFTKPEGVKGWNGPYVKSLSDDAWHNPYVLTVSGDKSKPFQVYSYGPDGVEGGGDDVYEHADSEEPSSGGSSSSGGGMPTPPKESVPLETK